MRKTTGVIICIVLLGTALSLITRDHRHKDAPPAIQADVQSRQPLAQSGASVGQKSTRNVVTQSSSSSTPNLTQNFIAQWQEQIRRSDRPQDQLLAGLLSTTDAGEQETFLLRALESMPNDLLLNYAIADHCGRHTHASLCALVDTQNLLTLDSENGYMWTTLANQAYRDGDTDRALHYLQQAVGLYQYNSQTPRLLQLIDDSLTYHGATRDFGLVTAAMGLQAAQVLPSQLGGVARMCREQSRWQDVCRSLGQTMMSQGREAMDVTIGQQLVSEASANEEQLPLPAEWVAFADSANSQEQSRLVDVLLAENPPVSDVIWNEYLRRYETEGAPAAFYFLIETLMAQEDRELPLRD